MYCHFIGNLKQYENSRGNSNKLEVFVMSSKGQGLGSQPDATLLLPSWKWDGNKSHSRQGKQMCSFQLVKHYIAWTLKTLVIPPPPPNIWLLYKTYNVTTNQSFFKEQRSVNMGIANPVTTYQHAKASTPMYIVEIDAIKKIQYFFFTICVYILFI